MLENHMVLPSASPDDKYDYLEPERDESCIVCNVTACLVDGLWYESYHVEEDAQDGPYLDGDYEYVDAIDTPHGWVCSKACRSQAMYAHASEDDKRALRRVRDACWMISADGKRALSLAAEGMDDCLTENLTEGACEFLEAIGEPTWCNEPSREEELEAALRDVLGKIKWLARDLGIEADSMRGDGHTWPHCAEAQTRHAEECAAIETQLKTVLEATR